MLHVDSAEKNSSAKQSVVMIVRYFSFVIVACNMISQTVLLDDNLFKFILKTEFLLGFYLQLLRNYQQSHTVLSYRDAFSKLVKFFMLGKYIQNDEQFHSVSITLEMVMAGRKSRDNRTKAEQHLKKTVLLENYDMANVRKLVDLDRILRRIEILEKATNHMSQENRKAYYVAQYE